MIDDVITLLVYYIASLYLAQIATMDRQLQMQHGKDPEEENASDGQSVIVIDIPVEEDALLVTDEIQNEDEEETIPAVIDEEEPDIHNQNDHIIAIQDEEASSSSQQQQLLPQEGYESNFPLKQSQPRAATTFSIFQQPNHFSSNYIYSNKIHYLTDDLSGMLYLDVNNDGLRGSYVDSTLNAKEYDTGVGGVYTTLVHCESNQLAMSGYPLSNISDVSRPNRGEGVVTEALQTDRTDAGLYNFDLSSAEPGRYYVMYQAPQDYRMSGNVLPLDYEVTTDGERKCIPKGGEGDGYLNEIYDNGDLDWSGYCARTVGCFEVAPKFDLKKSFTNLELLNDDDESKYEGSVESLVALPDKDTMNVGVSKEGWPLNTAQYADAEFTIRFPSPSPVTSDEEGSVSTSKSMEELKEIVVPEEFATSHVKKSLESTMAALFATRGSGDFDIQGFDFISGNIHEKRSEESKRMLRGLQRDREEDSRFISVTYTFTTRGKYSPPPFEQLGTIVSDSINADPVGLVKSLKDKDPVFEQVDDDVNVRHLTLKKEEKSPSNPIGAVQVFSKAQSSTDSGLASWATIPLILLSASIASLVGVLMFRRVLGTRRQKKITDDPLKVYMKSGSVGFTSSRRRSEDSDTKKKSRFRRRSSNSSESSFAADGTKEEETSGGRSSRRQQRELS